MSAFPMLACSAWSRCSYALCSVPVHFSWACNLILDPAECTMQILYSTASGVPQGSLSNSYETRCPPYAPPLPCCKSLVTVDRRWTAVCRLLNLSWHFLQWLLHIDKSLLRGLGEGRWEQWGTSIIAGITWACCKTHLPESICQRLSVIWRTVENWAKGGGLGVGVGPL